MSHNSNLEKQMRIEVTEDQHKQIRLRATDQGKSIKQYILDLVDKDLRKRGL